MKYCRTIVQGSSTRELYKAIIQGGGGKGEHKINKNKKGSGKSREREGKQSAFSIVFQKPR